jgi:predicted TIM-barrel fold metal-dependent hydrolase
MADDVTQSGQRKTPPPLTDVHCHLLPPELRQPVARGWQDPWFASCHQDTPRFAAGDDVVAALDQAGLDRAVVLGWPFADPGLLAEVNDYVADQARTSEGRLLGLALVNPSCPGWEVELRRCHELGLRGVGELNADAQGFELRFEGPLRDLLLSLVDMNWPLLFHASEPVGHQYPGKGTAIPARMWQLLAPALESAPGLRICLGHLGGGLPFYAHMPEVAALCRQLWFDTAALPYLYQPGVLGAVDQLLGTGRLCFGSDFPLLPPARYKDYMPELSDQARESLGRDAPATWLGEQSS